MTLISLPGHTYDRSVLVDGEETSLMVYDIWDQVRCTVIRVPGGDQELLWIRAAGWACCQLARSKNSWVELCGPVLLRMAATGSQVTAWPWAMHTSSCIP